jgi:hypothetical protein
LEVEGMGDPGLRREMSALLAANGYQAAPVGPSDPRLRSPKSAWGVAKAALKTPISKLIAAATGPSSTPAWLFLARRFGITPPGQNRFTFGSVEEAIDYARNISRGNIKRRHQADILQGRERPVPREIGV